MSEVIGFWSAHRAELVTLIGEHVMLVGIATAAAIALGVPLGIFAARRPRLAAPLVATASIVQTVPSLAMFGFLIPVPLIGGVGARAAVTVLILYGLLPIVRATIVGITGLDRAVREAGVAMGMTAGQLLRQVELPLAMPVIVSGVRVAAVVGVGSATIAAAIGAGGLGQYIYRGLSMVDSTVILAGAIPAALLAILVDLVLLWVERRLSRRRSVTSGMRMAAAAGAVALVAVLAAAALTSGSGDRIVVGSKNFTEQLILGEILAQQIERETGLTVQRKLNLGGTLICDRALLNGDIDVYVEYTGTALTAVFQAAPSSDRAAVTRTVRDRYAETGRTLLPGLGYDNTFAILVRGRDARQHNLRTISDAARLTPQWRAGFGYEFLDRPDGYRGLAAAYGLRFRTPPQAMDLTLTYRALASGQVDLIAGDATAGLIAGLDLAHLEDDRQYFPPYDAVPVARADMLLRHPDVKRALEALAGRITAAEMRRMNHAADALQQDPAAIAREFLERPRTSAAVEGGWR
jgi:osmoprotectant transport system permease protein